MKFVAFTRELQGTGASRRLRVSGKVPGIVFGAGAPAKIIRSAAEVDKIRADHHLNMAAWRQDRIDASASYVTGLPTKEIAAAANELAAARLAAVRETREEAEHSIGSRREWTSWALSAAP